MPDTDLSWGGDFIVSPSGDLSLVDGDVLTQQRIIRRLNTALRRYIYHLGYGAGLPQRIGRVARPATIQSIVRSQILLEASVASVPVPAITVASTPTLAGAYIITIVYFDNEGEQRTLTFDTSTGATPEGLTA